MHACHKQVHASNVCHVSAVHLALSLSLRLRDSLTPTETAVVPISKHAGMIKTMVANPFAVPHTSMCLFEQLLALFDATFPRTKDLKLQHLTYMYTLESACSQ